MIGPKVTLELRQYTETHNIGSGNTGDVSFTWTGKAFINGVLVPAPDYERFNFGNRQTVTSDHYFYCNRIIGFTVTNKDRFFYGNRQFDINSVEYLNEKTRSNMKFGLKEVVK